MSEPRTPWVRLRSAMLFAWAALLTGRQRALLALFGIAIGVAAMVTLVAIGQGLQQKTQDAFKAIGTQVVTADLNDSNLNPFQSKKRIDSSTQKRTTGDALIAAVAAMPEIESVSEVASLACEGRKPTDSQALSMVRPELAHILGFKMSSGRFMHVLDGSAIWVVLGAQAADQLAAKGYRIEPGETLSLCGKAMRLAGVLRGSAASEQLLPMSLDSIALVSSAAGHRMEPSVAINKLVLRLRPNVSPIDFSPKLAARLEELSGLNVTVTAPRQVLALMTKQANATTRFLVALSSLSLLVGALGILNVMLMSVLERRAEIGLRMAVGADDVDIGLQFLTESTLLGLAGGGIGIALGIAGAAITSAWAEQPFVITASGMALAFGVSLAVGIASGLYPAIKAAQLSPVEALQTA